MRPDAWLLTMCSALFASGCASDRVVQPAKTIGDAVTTFQTQLVSFQAALQTLQSSEQGLTASNNVRRDYSLATVWQKQLTQDMSEATTPTNVFKILQDRANTEVSALTAMPVATATPAAVKLPVDQVATVAKSVADIAKAPGTKAELEFLESFGSTVKKDLGAPKQATPAASQN